MKVNELIELLLKYKDHDMPVYFRRQHLTGNIVEVDRVAADTYGFFGLSLPCLILETASDFEPTSPEANN